ncbi:MAG: ABC transporter permease [Puniceicoccales bacterium]|jgi:lipoprotein-releasing system permease protein|nr:ABC transporter permease [Puniceicoccales bacterium]
MKWYAYFAWKQLFPTGRKLSFFSAMSIFGVALGVTVLFVVQSVMDGFQHNIRRAIVETQGDVRVESQDVECQGLIHGTDNLVSFLMNFPDVAAVAKYAYGITMLKCGGRTAFPMVKGIDVENEPKVVDLLKFVKHGSLEGLDCGGIALSSDLAVKIGAAVGSRVEIYSPLMVENSIDGDVILPKTLEVTMIFETGHHNTGRNTVFIAIDTLQDFYNIGDGIHGIALKVKPGVPTEKVAFALNQSLRYPLVAASWQEMNRDFLFALRMEKTMMFFVLVFILLISAFSIAGSMLISVIRKTREIGLISAIGGTVIGCSMCFFLQGAIIGIIGSTIGIIFATTVLCFRNVIVYSFAKLCGVEDFMLRFYSFANMPARYGVGDIFSTMAFAITLCCLAAVVPAIKVARINAAEALRSE